jgi:hypothetical protein
MTAGRVAQVVEHLSSKHKTLSSTPNPGKNRTARHWWLTLVILATQEVEIRRIMVQSQHEQNSSAEKNPSQKRAGRMAQEEGPEFKPQYHKKTKTKPRTTM